MMGLCHSEGASSYHNCSEMSARNYHFVLRNNPENRSSRDCSRVTNNYNRYLSLEIPLRNIRHRLHSHRRVWYCLVMYVKLKDRKRSLSGKKTTTRRCSIRETVTRRNVALEKQLQCEMWHYRNSQKGKIALWILQWRQWWFQTESHLQPLSEKVN